MSQLDNIRSKILSKAGLKTMLAHWHSSGEKIVFTNGCFDILHLGHIDYLSKAKDLGTILIVGLNTDSSVQRQGKAPDRPLVNQDARAILMASLQFVDAVVLFDEDTPYDLIKTVQPDILVKGNDYKAEEIVGYDIVTAKGGEVKTVELVKGYSTTSLVNKIKGIK